MNDPGPRGAEDESDRSALEAFVLDNDDLEALENLNGGFNIFEAIGAIRHELRHSELLAFLLDPNENHGLGDAFLRRFLQKAIAHASPPLLSPIDLDVWDFDEVDIRREWSNIDILILDRRNHVAVIVENKVGSAEHSDQLGRYWTRVEREVPGYCIIGLFLTPDRIDASDARYVAIDYGLVADIVSRFAATHESTMGPDVRLVLNHYVQMLRRHIVSDPKIVELCQKLYRKHRRALDLIFQHRPDPRSGPMREVFEDFIRESPALTGDDSTRTYLRFTPTQWDRPNLANASGWTKTRRSLLFEVVFSPDRIFLKLTLGPGETALREAVFAVACARPEIFKSNNVKSLSPKWHQLYQRTLVDSKTLSSDEQDTVEAVGKHEWDAFLTLDLPAIISALGAVLETG